MESMNFNQVSHEGFIHSINLIIIQELHLFRPFQDEANLRHWLDVTDVFFLHKLFKALIFYGGEQ
jgi:hypothetical protein